MEAGGQNPSVILTIMVGYRSWYSWLETTLHSACKTSIFRSSAINHGEWGHQIKNLSLLLKKDFYPALSISYREKRKILIFFSPDCFCIFLIVGNSVFFLLIERYFDKWNSSKFNVCFEKEKKKNKNQIWSLQLKRAEIKWNVNKINEISITYEWFALQQ